MGLKKIRAHKKIVIKKLHDKETQLNKNFVTKYNWLFFVFSKMEPQYIYLKSADLGEENKFKIESTKDKLKKWKFRKTKIIFGQTSK